MVDHFLRYLPHLYSRQKLRQHPGHSPPQSVRGQESTALGNAVLGPAQAVKPGQAEPK